MRDSTSIWRQYHDIVHHEYVTGGGIATKEYKPDVVRSLRDAIRRTGQLYSQNWHQLKIRTQTITRS